MENQKETKLKLFLGILAIALCGSLVMNYMLLSANDNAATQDNDEAVDEVSSQEEPATPSLPVTQLTPYVISQSDYAIKGGKYKARIVLAVDDTTYHQEFYVDGKRLNTNGVYEVQTSSVGLKKYSGSVSYVDPVSGDSIRKSFIGNYSVGEPAVTISNTDFNIMYSNYENKFAISVPGVSNDKVKVSVSGAQVKQQSGLWVIVPEESVKSVKINVSAEIEGKMLPMGIRDYRVKRLPAPQAYLSVREREYASGSVIPFSSFMHQSAKLIASYGPDGLLSLPFKITSFTVMINGVMTKCEGNHFSKEVLDRIAKLKAGSMIVITDINAVTPDGDKEYRLTPILFELK